MSAKSSWFTVPRPIKLVFDKFPLQTYPASDQPDSSLYTESKQVGKNGKKLKLYVYNLIETEEGSDIPSDPESLEIWGLLKLKNLGGKLQLIKSSVHSSPNNQIPYLIEQVENNERGKPNKRIYGNTKIIYKQLISSKTGQSTVYRNMIKTMLEDAWLMTLTFETESTRLQHKIYGQGCYRFTNIQAMPNETKNVAKEFPGFVENYLNGILYKDLISKLRVRYPAIESYTFNLGWNTSSVDKIKDEIIRRTIECFQVFEALLDESDTGYLGNGIKGDYKNNDDDKDESDVLENGLGPLDVSLFGYIYSIMKFAKDSELGRQLDKFESLKRHSEKVYQELNKL